jgi:hypothetical protein
MSNPNEPINTHNPSMTQNPSTTHNPSTARNPNNRIDADANKDPISGTPGAHPVGTGIGAVGVGAAAGALGGAVAGPVGAVVGAVGGAVVGGLGGKMTAEAFNPTVESDHWRKNYSTRPYALESHDYDEFEPAYRYGWESAHSLGDRNETFESQESNLGKGWDKAKGKSGLAWEQAKDATRDAWEKIRKTGRSDHRRM